MAPATFKIQRNLPKNTEEILFFHFLAISEKNVLVKNFQNPKINLSDQNGSFDTHIGILYEILCHMAYAIKCHNKPFYGILWHMPS